MNNKSSYNYHSIVKQTTIKITKLKKQLVFFSLVRLLFFLLALISPFLLYNLSLWITIALPLVLLFFFVWAVKKHISLASEKEFYQHILKINNDELKAIDHEFLHFDDGSKYINPDHFYTYDLDIFGRGSLFQFLNRTVTPQGHRLLAKMLSEPLENASEIIDRQMLVNELSKQVKWRQNFAATGKLYVETEAEADWLMNWKTDFFKLSTNKIIKVLLIVLPVFAVFSIVHWAVSGNSTIFIFSSLLQFYFWFVEKKNINLIYSQFGKREGLLKKYARLLTLIENFEWKSNEAKQMLANLGNNTMPSKEIKRLERIISAFDNRNNLLIGVVLNITLFWDVMCSYRIILWHNRNRHNFDKWMNTIALVDAICSLSNFAYNNKEFCFPKINDEDGFSLQATQLGHPLIHPKKRIDNDFLISDNNVLIITGANMAGKSTFLRTIGVNMVLGMSGAPVCAQNMCFKKVELFSNMRTSDSLFDDESYFFAELKRIKAILDEVDKGRELLIILDEILKGTNSVDKLAGSQKLIKRLIKSKVPSIIATHDLKLTEMETDYPNNVRNMCFEIVIENNEMKFDYLLRNGATTIMNASFLMKKMGIID